MPEIIGLIPAAGQARRLSPLPFSKELCPIEFQSSPDDDSPNLKVICEGLLDRLREAGIRKAYMILREGKWDIPAYLGDGERLDMHLAYLMLGTP